MSKNKIFLLIYLTLGIVPALSLIFCIIYLIYVPAWQVFLQWNSPIRTVLVLLLGFPLLGMINLPIPLKLDKNFVGLNLLSVGTPMVLLPLLALQIQPRWNWLMLVPFVFSTLLYHTTSWVSIRGVRVIGWTITLTGISTVYTIHLLSGTSVREAMWWAFLIQFISALLVVGLRSFRGSKKIHAYDLFLTLGGSGVRNALWAGPSISLALTYIGYSLFWGGIHGVGG